MIALQHYLDRGRPLDRRPPEQQLPDRDVCADADHEHASVLLTDLVKGGLEDNDVRQQGKIGCNF